MDAREVDTGLAWRDLPEVEDDLTPGQFGGARVERDRPAPGLQEGRLELERDRGDRVRHHTAEQVDDLDSPVRSALADIDHQPLTTAFSQRTERVPLSVTSAVCICPRSEEHTSELQSLMRISYAVFCMNKKK